MDTVILPKLVHPRCDAKFKDSCITSSTYIAERKYDGGRVYIYCEDGRTRTVMRSGIDRTGSFEVQYLPDLEGTILDCELYDPQGFNESLSGILGGNSADLKLAVFDIPFLGGKDLRRIPLHHRRSSYLSVIAILNDSRIHAIDWITEDKMDFFKSESSAGREGIILKKLGCGYGIEWIKLKGFHDTSVVLLGPSMARGELAVRIGVSDIAKARMIELGTVKVTSVVLNSYELGTTVVDIKAHSFDALSLRFRFPSLVKVRSDLSSLDCTLEKVKIDMNAG